VNVTFVPLQIDVPVFALMETEAATEGLTVIVIRLDVSGLPVMHVAFEVIIHRMTFPFAGTVVNDGLLVPEFTPFTCHRYVGEDPPFTGVAVKVTLVPWQTVADGDAETVTLAVDGALEETVILFDVRKHGLFSDAGSDNVQFSSEPVSTAARSYTISVHVPFGFIAPPPIAANVASVAVLQDVNAPDGL
jgi:hypothetical protein